MKFTVTIYHGDILEDDVPVNDVKLIHSASRMSSITLSASDEREAAAKVWIQVVGRAREARLKELNAPELIIAEQTNVRAIADQLRTTALCMAMFELYNGAEVWYFRVMPPAEANPVELCSDMFRQKSDSRPNTQSFYLSTILMPSQN